MEPSALKVTAQGIFVGFTVVIVIEFFRLDLYHNYIYAESFFDSCLREHDVEYCSHYAPYLFPYVLIFIGFYWTFVFLLTFSFGFLFTKSYEKYRVKNFLMLSITVLIFGGGLHSLNVPNMWYISTFMTLLVVFMGFMLGNKCNKKNQQI